MQHSLGREARSEEGRGDPFMRKPCSILLLCVLVGFGLSVIVPAEDVPETAYDESEALPYVSTPLVSIAAPKPAGAAPGGTTILALLRLDSLRRFVLDHRAISPRAACDSLTILDHTLRC